MRRGRVEDEREEQLTQLGVQPEIARAWIAQQTPLDDNVPCRQFAGEAVVVWPENWPALQLFLRLQTQWRASPRGQLLGLRYGAAATTIKLLGLRRRRRLFKHLQDMEQAVIEGQADE